MSQQRAQGLSRNSHIVPAFVLKHFAKDGYLMRRDLQADSDETLSPRDVRLTSRDFYTFQRPDGTDTDLIETTFGVGIENDAAPLITGLIRNPGKFPPQADERIKLAYFVAFQLVRGPSFRDEVGQLIRASARQTQPALVQNVAKAIWLKKMQEVAYANAAHLVDGHWTLLTARNLITNDAGALLWDRMKLVSVRLRRATTHAVIPIAPTHVLVIACDNMSESGSSLPVSGSSMNAMLGAAGRAIYSMKQETIEQLSRADVDTLRLRVVKTAIRFTYRLPGTTHP